MADSPAKPISQRRRIFNKKMGIPTKPEKMLIAQFVADQTQEITPSQITGLAKTLRRTKEMVRRLVEEAKESFVESAVDYVRIHKQATDAALASGTVAGLEVAVGASQWAMENLSAEGARIIDKAAGKGSGSPVINVGVKIGGMNEQPVIGVTVND